MHLRVRLVLSLLVILPGSGAAQSHRVQSEAGEASASEDRPRAAFSLLPRAFQRRPHLDFNFITETSIAGKSRSLPTPENPIFYVTQPGGFLAMGPGASAGSTPLEISDLESVLRRALADAGYLAADEAGPRPGLAVIFHWGSYTVPTLDGEVTASEQLSGVLTDVARRKDVIERAALVGGLQFADDLAKALNEEATFANQHEGSMRVNSLLASGGGGNPIGGAIMGSMPGFGSMFSSFERFRTQSRRNEQLVETAFGDIYFVIASAYDHDAIARGEPVLLWRTKMTVSAKGVAMRETVLPLIAQAGPYLGREMTEAATISSRIDRVGTVEMGETEVLGIDDAPDQEKESAARDPGQQ